MKIILIAVFIQFLFSSASIVSSPVLTFHLFPGLSGECYTYNYVDYNDGDSVKNISMASAKNGYDIKVDLHKEKCTLLIKSERKPAKVILNGGKSNLNWKKDVGMVEINLDAEKAAEVNILF